MQLADLRLDPAARRAWRGDRELELSKTEFDLLELLVRNQGVVLDHSTIYDRIWHYDFGPDSKNLAVYIGYLRRKTEAEGEPRLIQTVRGVGYSAREAHRRDRMSLRWRIAIALAARRRGDDDLGRASSSYRATSARLLEEVDRSLDQALAARSSRRPHAAAASAGCSTCSTSRSSTAPARSSTPPTRPFGPARGRPRSSASPAESQLRHASSTDDGDAARPHASDVPDGAVQVGRSLDENEQRAARPAQADDPRSSASSPSRPPRSAGLIATHGHRAARAPDPGGDRRRAVGPARRRDPGRRAATRSAGSATAFNGMLDALAASRADQQRLVEDAGHELRTPLTSVRTNLAVLRRHPDLDPRPRASRCSTTSTPRPRSSSGSSRRSSRWPRGVTTTRRPSAIVLGDARRPRSPPGPSAATGGR